MKKASLTTLAILLLLALAGGQALAMTGDITTKAVKAYSDPNMKNYIGTLPKYTSVQVRTYGPHTSVYANGTLCYISVSALTCGRYDSTFVGVATLKEDAVVYQRPSFGSKGIAVDKDRDVLVYTEVNGYALIRSGFGGTFGFVPAGSLKNFRSRS